MTTKVWRHDLDYNKTNIPYLLFRRIKWLLGDRAPLISFLKITRRCNLDCDHCPWHAAPTDYTEELSAEQWRSIVAELYNQGCRIFALEGGEPTLRKDLDAILDSIHQRGGLSILATNGTTKPWHFAATGYTVSVDGPREVHDQIRGDRSYEKVLKNLQQRGNRRVLCITVLTRRNWRRLQDHVASLSEYVDAFLFTFLYPYAGLTKSLGLSPPEIRKVKLQLLELKQEYPILNPTKYLTRPFTSSDCRHYISVSVDYRGQKRHGCFVGHLEPRRCQRCELSCYQELSALHDFNLEAWFNFYRLFLRAL